MATSGYKDVKVTNWNTLRFSWTLASQDVAKNTSRITWKLELLSGSDGAISSTAAKDWSVTVNGANYSGTNTIGIGSNTSKTLASGSTTITHSADGTKTFAYSFSQEFAITFSGSSLGTFSGSGSGTLTTIPRASQPSLITWPETTGDVGNFGDEIAIHMNRNADTFTHTVRYAFGNLSGTIATGVTTGTTWTIPLSFMDLLPAATKGSGLIYVDTYSGSTLVGTKYTGFTAHVPASVRPVCSVQVLDATTYKDTYGNLVRGLSKLKVRVSGSAAYGSPLAAFRATANGSTYTAAEFTTAALHAAGTTMVSATVTDKRGRTSAAAVASFPVLDYASPAVTALSVQRCQQSGTVDPAGAYIKATFSAKITALNNKNSAAYKIRYKKSTATSYAEAVIAAQAGKYTVTNATYIFAADVNSSYDVEVVATDDIGTATRSNSAPTAFTLMDWGVGQKNMAIGKVAEKANSLEIGLRAYDQYGTHISNGMSLYGGANSHIDANTTTEHLILTALNTPDTSLWYVETIFYSTKTTTSDRRQIAMPYRRGGASYSRYYTAGAWTAWESDALAAWPVGSIYLAYNHTNPGTLFGGTWTRIQNAFLWATTSSGTIGQTGGEQTVTLTEAQMPKHNHGGTYTNAGTARTHAWLTSNGSAMGYDSVEAGSGEAHNNMPPYIQVSVWRRTA